jgi:hypothetical protein
MPDHPFVRVYGVPEFVAQTTYAEIFQTALRAVLEGQCPNCGGSLVEWGWCAACRLSWAATADPQTRRAAIILDATAYRLRWMFEPMPPVNPEAVPPPHPTPRHARSPAPPNAQEPREGTT